MLDTEREEQLLQVLLLLKEESQRLVRRHKEIQEEFDCVVHELYVLRRKRRVREGREIFSRLDNVALLMPRSAGGGDAKVDNANISTPEAPGEASKDRRR
jgi:hypothetical protein